MAQAPLLTPIFHGSFGAYRESRLVEGGFSLIADGSDGCEDGLDRGRGMGHHRYV